jgi:hypothetical protein
MNFERIYELTHTRPGNAIPTAIAKPPVDDSLKYLESIRAATFAAMEVFEKIAWQIRPTFETLDTWKTTNHSKLDESTELRGDFDLLTRRLETLNNTIMSFKKEEKPIQNKTGAKSLIETIAGYITTTNTNVRRDGFEVDEGNEAQVFEEMQRKYYEFIAMIKVFFNDVRKEGFEPPETKDVYGTKL